MGRSIERGLDQLAEHYMAFCAVLALFILTLLGVGSIPVVCLLGIILCVVGLAQRSAQADPWILIPLFLYNIVSMASSFSAYGNITDGFASTQLIFPILYLLLTCMSGAEQRLTRYLCVLWAAAAAVIGIGQFTLRAVALGAANRLSGLLGNPNAMGIFLVLSWFALLHILPALEQENTRQAAFFRRLEPVLLTALALTLSMGSFVSMAVGILFLVAAEKRRSGWKAALLYACRLLAKAALGIGTGLLIYLGASRTGLPWFCLPLLAYAGALTVCWPKLERFLSAYPNMAVLLSACGLLVAAAAVAVRPSSLATFAERIEMMANGLGYLTRDPLLGIGPYQWRVLNLYDSDTYFNTWHIHNALLHVGVEMGWIAMAALAAVVVRAFQKRPAAQGDAKLPAYCFHNLIDTSFFYLGITAFVLLTSDGRGGKKLNTAAVRGLFGISAALFVCHLIYYIVHSSGSG